MLWTPGRSRRPARPRVSYVVDGCAELAKLTVFQYAWQANITEGEGRPMADTSVVKRTYPWQTSVGGVEMTLRLMEPSDRDTILSFGR